MNKPATLSLEELKRINDAMPSEAKYGEVFREIAKRQRDDTLKQFIKWGDEVCMEHGMKKRRRCDKCWSSLQKEIEG